MPQPQKSRRETLESAVKANPSAAFVRYGLALECASTGDSDAAVGHFQALLAEHPEYVPAYHQFGQLLARLGRIQEARQMLSAGIQAAETQGVGHARDEMQALLSGLS